MFKSVATLADPDPRYRDAVFRDNVTGQVRAATLEDFHGLVAQINLDSAAPDAIREQFDKARNAFVYSWYAYDIATFAEQQAYAVVEMAIREKLQGLGRKPPRGLRRLLKEATGQGWLSDQAVHLIDLLPHMRNELAHGSVSLNPFGSLDMLRFCAEILNTLYRKQIS